MIVPRETVLFPENIKIRYKIKRSEIIFNSQQLNKDFRGSFSFSLRQCEAYSTARAIRKRSLLLQIVWLPERQREKWNPNFTRSTYFANKFLPGGKGAVGAQWVNLSVYIENRIRKL